MNTHDLRQFFLFSVILVFIGCNTIPDGVNYNNVTLHQNQVGKNYKVDSIMVFNFVKDYSIDFYGIRICTTSVKGSISFESDSLYRKITCIGDTVLITPDSTYGLAEFRETDVMSWDSLYSRIKAQKEIIGEILADFLDPDTIALIQSSQTLSSLPRSVKKSVLNSLNTILSTYDFYYTYKEKIENDVFFLPVLAKMYGDAQDLVARNIFLDTLGAVKENLTFYEQEKVKWFNWRLLARYIDNEANAADFGKLFSKFSISGRIFALLFQQGKSPDELSGDIIRFISERDSGLYQVAYKDETGFQIPSDKIVLNYVFMCDLELGASPFFWQPEVSFISGTGISSLLNPGKATAKYTGFSAVVDSIWYYDLNMFHLVSGTVKLDGSPLRIIGTINTTFGFYKSSSYLLEINQAYFTGWNTYLHIRGVDCDGELYDYKELFILKSDDGTG